MNIIAPFGFVTACHRGDYPLVRATCASIAHQMPGTPLALIVDGDVDVTDVVRVHNVIPLPVRQLTDARLVRACSGNYYAKWTAFWSAPFERFVYLDSDALLLGDWSDLATDTAWEFCIFTSATLGTSEKSGIAKHFFNPDLMQDFDPAFNWADLPYFCAGAFAAQRNFITPEEFLRFIESIKHHPDLFDGTDQGPLNYLVLKARQQGRRVIVRNRQFILPDHPPQETLQRFGSQILPHAQPWIVHYCGVKPWLHNRQPQHVLFSTYRRRHHLAAYGSGLLAHFFTELALFREEAAELSRKLRGRMLRLIRSLRP